MSAPPTLLVIDAQQGLQGDQPYYGGVRNNPEAENNMRTLLALYRKNDWPRVFVRHASTNADSPLHPDAPGYAWTEGLAPEGGETEFIKNVNSAFIGTPLEGYLREREATDLLVVGLTTDHCVSTSVRMAANLGFRVTLAGDTTATHGRIGPDGCTYTAEAMHAINLASLHGEFCQVKTTADILTELER